MLHHAVLVVHVVRVFLLLFVVVVFLFYDDSCEKKNLQNSNEEMKFEMFVVVIDSYCGNRKYEYLVWLLVRRFLDCGCCLLFLFVVSSAADFNVTELHKNAL